MTVALAVALEVDATLRAARWRVRAEEVRVCTPKTRFCPRSVAIDDSFLTESVLSSGTYILSENLRLSKPISFRVCDKCVTPMRDTAAITGRIG